VTTLYYQFYFESKNFIDLQYFQTFLFERPCFEVGRIVSYLGQIVTKMVVRVVMEPIVSGANSYQYQ
jgi:hypothetical protein